MSHAWWEMGVVRGQDEERKRKSIPVRITHPPLAQGNTVLKEVSTRHRHENTNYVLIKQHAESFTNSNGWAETCKRKILSFK